MSQNTWALGLKSRMHKFYLGVCLTVTSQILCDNLPKAWIQTQNLKGPVSCYFYGSFHLVPVEWHHRGCRGTRADTVHQGGHFLLFQAFTAPLFYATSKLRDNNRLPLPKQTIYLLLQNIVKPSNFISPHILQLCGETSHILCKLSFFHVSLILHSIYNKASIFKTICPTYFWNSVPKKDILLQRIWTTVQKATGCTANHGFQTWIHFKSHDRKP